MQLLKIVFLISIILTLSCQDEENNNIPAAEVNLIIQLNDPEFINLQTIGGWEYIIGGSRGIILVRISQNEFKAYDRHCTFQPSNTCALVSVDANNITATDDCCSSSFLLLDGSVSKPPASVPLKSYPTIFDGSAIIITN